MGFQCPTRVQGSRRLRGEKYRCNLCVHFVAFTLALFLNHLVRYHTSDPNFHVLCGINGCSKTYRNCISFKNHIKRKHADLLLARTEMVKLQNINIRTPDTNDMNGDSLQADEDRGETYDSASLPQSKKNSCKRSSRNLFQESGLS